MSKRKPPPKRDDPEQSKRFEETARELEADESGKSFEDALGATLPVKPTPEPAHRPRPAKSRA